jgi:hypothetical protein
VMAVLFGDVVETNHAVHEFGGSCGRLMPWDAPAARLATACEAGRHCERSEAIQSVRAKTGLLRRKGSSQ